MLPFPFGFHGVKDSFFDPFDRANSDVPGHGWIEHAGDWDIVSNVIQRTTTGSNDRLLRPAAEAISDGWAEAKILGSGQRLNVLFRYNPSSDSGYLASWISTTELVLSRRDSGTNVGIGNATGLTQGGVIRLEGIGSAIKVYQDGVQRISVTDATYASGRVGLRGAVATAGFEADDFRWRRL